MGGTGGKNLVRQLVWYNSKNKGTGKTLCKCVTVLPWEKHGHMPSRESTGEVWNVPLFYTHLWLSFKFTLSLINTTYWHIKIGLEEIHLWMETQIFVNKTEAN